MHQHAERLDEEDAPAQCDDQGLWCRGTARWLVGGRRLCTPCKRVADEAAPHDDTFADGGCP